MKNKILRGVNRSIVNGNNEIIFERNDIVNIGEPNRNFIDVTFKDGYKNLVDYNGNLVFANNVYDVRVINSDLYLYQVEHKNLRVFSSYTKGDLFDCYNIYPVTFNYENLLAKNIDKANLNISKMIIARCSFAKSSYKYKLYDRDFNEVTLSKPLLNIRQIKNYKFFNNNVGVNPDWYKPQPIFEVSYSDNTINIIDITGKNLLPDDTTNIYYEDTMYIRQNTSPYRSIIFKHGEEFGIFDLAKLEILNVTFNSSFERFGSIIIATSIDDNNEISNQLIFEDGKYISDDRYDSAIMYTCDDYTDMIVVSKIINGEERFNMHSIFYPSLYLDEWAKDIILVNRKKHIYLVEYFNGTYELYRESQLCHSRFMLHESNEDITEDTHYIFGYTEYDNGEHKNFVLDIKTPTNFDCTIED